MASYVLSHEAEQDLLEIGRYTVRTWSIEQAARYLLTLEDHFDALATRAASDKAVFDHRADYRVSRCQHHYVFFVREAEDRILVLAVLHENMDLVARSRERFGPTGPAS